MSTILYAGIYITQTSEVWNTTRKLSVRNRFNKRRYFFDSRKCPNGKSTFKKTSPFTSYMQDDCNIETYNQEDYMYIYTITLVLNFDTQ